MEGCQVAQLICGMLVFTVVATGVDLLFTWLTAHRHRPEFYINDFSISIASRHHRQQSGLANLTVRFAVTSHNPNKKVGIYCKDMTASVYYGNQLVASGPVVPPSFYLAPKKADGTVEGALNATGPTATDPAWAWFADEVAAGGVAMRLLLDAKLRFKYYPTKHHLTVECDFRLGEQRGNLLELQQQDKNSRCGV